MYSSTIHFQTGLLLAVESHDATVAHAVVLFVVVIFAITLLVIVIPVRSIVLIVSIK